MRLRLLDNIEATIPPTVLFRYRGQIEDFKSGRSPVLPRFTGFTEFFKQFVYDLIFEENPVFREPTQQDQFIDAIFLLQAYFFDRDDWYFV